MQIEDDRLILRLVNDTASVDSGQHALRNFLVSAGASERAIFHTELAFEELVTNVIRHAYAGRARSRHAIDVDVQVEAAEIVLTVEDDGPPFDPVRAPDPPLPASIEEARVGGLGLRFIRAGTTRVTYQRVDNKNRVTVFVDRHSRTASDG